MPKTYRFLAHSRASAEPMKLLNLPDHADLQNFAACDAFLFLPLA